MLRSAIICLSGILLITNLQAATKTHAITFGKWQTITANAAAGDENSIELKVRGMFVDGKLKEYTIGQLHDVTDRSFVVRRAFRINDALPGESPGPSRWLWERGGWLLVDRSSGRVSSIPLPLMESLSCAATWYRDYLAYCGIADDGKKLYAVVAQVGRRKPLLRQYMGTVTSTDVVDPAFTFPRWERNPSRVTFDLPGTDRLVFALHARALEIVEDSNSDED